MLSAGAVLAGVAVVPALAAETLPAARMVLVDRTLAAARPFADQARLAGMIVILTDGDLTSLWMDHLEQLWRREPAALGGLTRPGALAFLQLMARRNRMRLSMRNDHDLASGRMLHRAAVPAALAEDARVWLGADWTGGSARLMASCPAAAPALAINCASPAFHGPATDAGQTVSWLITPLTGEGTRA